MIYLFLGLYLFSLVVIYDINRRTEYKNFNFFLALILMVGLVTFRYRVGGDTLNYIYHFEQTTPGLYALHEFGQKWQPIPAIIFTLCKMWFNDFTYVQAIFAVFVNSVVFHFFRKYTRYYFTAIFLFALTFYMRLNCEIMRESLAISFFLLGYPYMMKHKYLKYYIFSVLAFLCHSSAILIFALPLMQFLNKRGNFFYLLLLFTIIMGFIFESQSVMGSFAYYVKYFEDYDSSIYGKLGIILNMIVLPLSFMYFYREHVSDFVKKGLYAYVGCAFLSLFFYIAYRFNNYFVFFYILLMSDLLNYIILKRKYAHFWSREDFWRASLGLKYYLVMLLFLFSFMKPYFNDVSSAVGHKARWYCVWYPYYSIFDKQEDADREAYIRNRGGF